MYRGRGTRRSQRPRQSGAPSQVIRDTPLTKAASHHETSQSYMGRLPSQHRRHARLPLRLGETRTAVRGASAVVGSLSGPARHQISSIRVQQHPSPAVLMSLFRLLRAGPTRDQHALRAMQTRAGTIRRGEAARGTCAGRRPAGSALYTPLPPTLSLSRARAGGRDLRGTAVGSVEGGEPVPQLPCAPHPLARLRGRFGHVPGIVTRAGTLAAPGVLVAAR